MNYSESLPGVNGLGVQADIKISTSGVGKMQYFASGATGYKLPTYLSKEMAAEWNREYRLCDCSNCYDSACIVRQKHARFPIDAGGANQCLRMMQDKTPFVFRNGGGLVIEIPPEIVKAIREGG